MGADWLEFNRPTVEGGAVQGIIIVGLIVILGLLITLLPFTWVVVLILGSIVVGITLVWPQFGVLALVPAIPFGSLRQFSLGPVNVGLAELLLALVLAAWLMRLVIRRDVRLRWPPIAWSIVLFTIVLLFSLIGATSLAHGVKEILKWVEVLALYVLVANEMSGGWKRALILTILGTGAVVALHGIYQFLFQVGPEGFVLFGRFMRAYGTFQQPNPYAGYLGLLLPVAIALILAGLLGVRGRVGWRWVVWSAACAALMLAALVMSWSRGAWLGFAAALIAMVFVVTVQSGRVAVLAAVGLVLLAYLLLALGQAFIPPTFIQRFADFAPYLGLVEVRGIEVTDANFAVLERMAHWQSALRMWTDHPWLGVGIGNYEPVYARYALPLWPLPLGHAHNYYLNVAAEAGLLGLGAYLLLWGVAFLVSVRSLRRSWGWHWAVALGVFGALVHLSVHNLFDNLFVHGMYLQMAILLGVIATDARNPDTA